MVANEAAGSLPPPHSDQTRAGSLTNKVTGAVPRQEGQVPGSTLLVLLAFAKPKQPMQKSTKNFEILPKHIKDAGKTSY